MPMLTPEQVRKLEEQHAAASAEPPGIGASFKRGLYRSPANVLGMADSMRRRTSMIPGVNGPEPLAQVMDRGQIARSGVIAEPQGLLPQAAERMGMQAPLSAGSIAASGLAGGAWAVKDAVIQDLSSNVASQYAKRKGFGLFGQAVAGIVGAMVAPTRAPSFLTNRFGKAAQDAAEEAPAPFRTLSDSEIDKLAKQHDVKPDDMRAVAKMVQQRIQIDPITGQPKLDELVNQLDEVARIFPNPKVRPTTAQAAGKLGGGNLVAAEDAATLADPVINSRVSGIRDAVAEDLSQRWDSLVKEGSTDGALEKFAGLKATEKVAKANAWDAVPFDELPKRPAATIVNTLESMKNDRTLLYRNVPFDVRGMIENFGDEVTARDLQDLRARLGEIAEEGLTATDRSVQMSAKAARDLRKVVDDQLNQLPEDGSQAYRDAIGATNRYYELFPTESKAVKAFSKYTDRSRIAGEVLRADDPVDEIKTAINIYSKTEGGMDDLRAVFMKHLVGENLGDVPMSTVRRALSNERTTAVYKELLGRDDFATFKDILKGYQIGTSGTSGTAAQMTKTQSAQIVQRLTSIISSPGQTIKGAAKAVDEAITRDSASQAAQQKILNELIFDLGLTRKLAQIPLADASEKEVTSWLKSWSTIVARAAVRSQARAASRAPAMARAAVGPMVVNQPFPDMRR